MASALKIVFNRFFFTRTLISKYSTKTPKQGDSSESETLNFIDDQYFGTLKQVPENCADVVISPPSKDPEPLDLLGDDDNDNFIDNFYFKGSQKAPEIIKDEDKPSTVVNESDDHDDLSFIDEQFFGKPKE
jgi:hypothetical protein